MTRLVVDGTMRRVPNALNARRGGANGGLSDLVSAGEFFAMVAARAGIDAHSASALMTDYSSILGQDPDGGAAGGLAPDIALLKDGSIKDRKYTPDDVGLPSECPVCLCNFTVGQRVKVLPCQHAFCSACTNRWLGFSAREATCPLCRSQVKRATAKAGVEAPQLFSHAERAALPKLELFKAQDISNTAYAYALAGVGGHVPALFDGMVAQALRREKEFKAQEISNTVWAYATAEFRYDGADGKSTPRTRGASYTSKAVSEIGRRASSSTKVRD